jgi:dihydroceramidase
MGASLDQDQRRVVLTVSTVVTVIITCLSWYAEFHVAPKLAVQTQKSKPMLLQECIKTLICMAVATAIVAWPITTLRNTSPSSFTDLTSSINFCEPDFEHTRWIAEPANAVSNIFAYIPLAITGLKYSTKLRYRICYVAIIMIGVGSLLLHSLLTAETQGGDELPMLWYCAAASYCGFSVIFSESSNLVGPLVLLSALVATCVYLKFRSNFIYFYLLFDAYVITLLLSLLYITLIMDIEKRRQGALFKQQILLPLARATAWTTVSAIWIWVLEMSYCSQAQSSDTLWVRFLFNRVLHPCWHFLTGLLASLVVQIFVATERFLSRGRLPSIQWMGGPMVIFESDNNKVK